jgi:hypothetical protein
MLSRARNGTKLIEMLRFSNSPLSQFASATTPANEGPSSRCAINNSGENVAATSVRNTTNPETSGTGTIIPLATSRPTA